MIDMAVVLAVSTNKGGVLKTSLTTNLAGLLAKESRVLIVDADNQGNVSSSFGKNADRYTTNLYDVLVNGVPAADAIVNVYKNIDMLPSNDEMASFETDVITDIAKYKDLFFLMRNTLASIRDSYDYILVDTPPNLGLVTGNVLTFADRVLIPFQPETYSQRSLVKVLKAIAGVRLSRNPELAILGVVGTLVDSRTSLHAELLSGLRKKCLAEDIKCFDTVIPRSIRYASAVAYDELPATLAEARPALIKAYSDLLAEIKEELMW